MFLHFSSRSTLRHLHMIVANLWLVSLLALSRSRFASCVLLSLASRCCDCTLPCVRLAKLPVTAGGLGLPHLPTLALVARASCIATLPRAAHTDIFLRQEGAHLLERLRGISEKHPAQMSGDLMDAPPGLGLRHLSRKLTRSINSRAVSDSRRRRAELSETIRYQWLRKPARRLTCTTRQLSWPW